MSWRGRLTAVIAGVVVFLLIGYFFLIKPRQSDLSEVKDAIAAAQGELAAKQAELLIREQLKAQAPQLRAELARFRELVPNKDQVANFIFQVQEAADFSGVGFVQITPELPKQPPEGALLAEVRIAIRAKGGYFAIQDFIRRLYRLDRALRIDLFSINGVENDDEAERRGRTEMQVTARIFFALPAGGVTGAAPPPAGTTGSEGTSDGETTTTEEGEATPSPTP